MTAQRAVLQADLRAALRAGFIPALGRTRGSVPGRKPGSAPGTKRIALAASVLLHVALAVAILSGKFEQRAPREEPKAIDLVSVEQLLPPPPPPMPREIPKPEQEPLPEPSATKAQPPQAPPQASEAPKSTLNPEPSAVAEDLGPTLPTSGGMTVPTAPFVEGATGPATSAAPHPAAASVEPDYLPQFKITAVPVVPAKSVLAKIAYPPLAAKQGIEATVYLELFIDSAGKIRKVTVLKDPGYGFADAAVTALAGLICSPAMMDDKAVAVRFRYPVRFTLK